MAGDKKQLAVWLTLGTLILLVPVFWHSRCPQSPFLYSKELLVKYSVPVLLGMVLWNYNKFFSIFFLACYIFTFSNLSERSLWALSNLRDFFLFYLLLRLIVKPKDTRFLLGLWFIALILPLIMTWLQFLNIDFLRQGSDIYHGWFHGNQFRTRGFFGNPHFMHCWIALCAPLVFLMPLYLAIPSLIFLIISILICGSRGGSFLTLIISSATTFSLLYIKKRHILVPAITALVSGLTIFIGFGPRFLGFLQVRYLMLSAIWPRILAHPILGNGFNSFGGLNIHLPGGTLELQAHNEYIQVYTELGIFSLAIFFFIAYYLRRFKEITQKEGAILRGIFCGFLINSLYSFPFHLAHSALFFLTIVASCDILLEKQKT